MSPSPFPNSQSLWGAIEAGGTKILCAIACDPRTLLAATRIPTTSPTETIAQIVAFFQDQQAQLGPLTALGVGSFGPVDVIPGSATYGYLLKTPKPEWTQIDLVSPLADALNCPIGFDTDVNAAALGEHRWGNAQGLDTFIYLTIGTGIGGGGMTNGQLMHGLTHPEMGHIRVPHDREQDPFPGCCPFHGDCLEGLASGVALRDRWGAEADTLPPNHPAWDLEAHYLAEGLRTLIFCLSPQRIILGGGVMEQGHLFPKIRDRVKLLVSPYLDAPAYSTEIETYIVPPKLGGRAGLMGAFALAQQSLQGSEHG
jgi:fructokinase